MSAKTRGEILHEDRAGESVSVGYAASQATELIQALAGLTEVMDGIYVEIIVNSFFTVASDMASIPRLTSSQLFKLRSDKPAEKPHA